MGDVITIVQQRPQDVGIGGQLAAGLQASDLKQPVATKSVMSGESLKVTSGAATDLDKLVAQLKVENEDTRKTVAQCRIAMLMTVLNSMSLHISETQKSNLMRLELLNLELIEVGSELEGYTADKAVAEGRSAELEAKIQALEEAIKQAIEDGETHREQMEQLKAQKELEDAKILRLTNSIKSATVKMAELKDKIASCSEAIGAATLDEVAAAVKAAAGEVKAPQDAESDAEREKAEKKAEAMDVSNIIHDALDKMCDDIAKMIADRRLEPV